MNALRKLLAPALALVALVAVSDAALAGGVYCRPRGAAGGVGAGTIGGANSQVPSGTLYALNSNGCVGVAQQDVGYFLSQGFFSGTNTFTLTQTAIAANQTASGVGNTLPSGAMITNIVVHNTTANAVTGGVNIGTAAAGAQVVSALAVAANALVTVPQSAILAQTFNSTGTPVAQPLYVNAVTAFNSASLNVTIFYALFTPE